MEQRWVALAVLTLARVSMAFQFQSLASVAPLLVRDLGIGYADVGFLVGLYMLPGIVLALQGGLLGRRFGDKRVLVVGLGLMVAGGALMGIADGYALLLAGRLLSGIGGVLLNVLMSKMVTDWFAGREIVLAMTIFVNSFPIGIGLALLGLGSLSERVGESPIFHSSAAVALAALLLVAFCYRPHPNDRRDGGSTNPSRDIPWRELLLVAMPGAIWGLSNGAFTIMISFTPILLIGSGATIAKAGFIVGVVTWLIVASVQAGGIIAHRWGHQNLLMVASVAAWGLALLLVPSVGPVLPLLAIGVTSGLPVGVTMALPAEVMRTENRAVGMGVFYSFLYAGHAALPPIGGAIQDAVGGTGASLYFAAFLVLSILPLFALFRWAQHRSGWVATRA